MPTDDEMRIDASPTKDFFISMLIKDIDLIDAIADLVDNSVDGARSLRQSSNFDGLYVHIEANPTHFKITDNCGGFSAEKARKYAFKFGRPIEAGTVTHSIGQFGVGMKRALFKIGEQFHIESRTSESYFVLEDNVTRWRSDPADWSFTFAKVAEKPQALPEMDTGTSISVTALRAGVSQDFSTSSFQTRLNNDLSDAHRNAIDSGLVITLNGIPLRADPLLLLESSDLKPAFEELTIGTPEDRVSVKIYSGISDADPNEAGWCIFCNGRLVLKADQSGITGWGEGSERTNPQYHNNFARYRGFVFFEADKPSLLPWTTTKTSVDVDSPVYRAVRLRMTVMMRPVIDFLYKVANEKTGRSETDDLPLELAIKQAKSVPLTEVHLQPKFVSPRPLTVQEPPNTGRIQYSKPTEEIERVKKALKVKSLKDVGEKTFEYFLAMECDE